MNMRTTKTIKREKKNNRPNKIKPEEWAHEKKRIELEHAKREKRRITTQQILLDIFVCFSYVCIYLNSVRPSVI